MSLKHSLKAARARVKDSVSVMRDDGVFRFLKTIFLHLGFVTGLCVGVHGVYQMHEPIGNIITGLTVCVLVLFERADMLNKAGKTK